MADFPGAITLAYNAETRLGMFWYHPERKVMAFSPDSRSHFHFENFPDVKDLPGWIRGFVFKYEGKNHILIYKGDFGEQDVRASTLEEIRHFAELMCKVKILDIFSESGACLLVCAPSY